MDKKLLDRRGLMEIKPTIFMSALHHYSAYHQIEDIKIPTLCTHTNKKGCATKGSGGCTTKPVQKIGGSKGDHVCWYHRWCTNHYYTQPNLLYALMCFKILFKLICVNVSVLSYIRKCIVLYACIYGIYKW